MSFPPGLEPSFLAIAPEVILTVGLLAVLLGEVTFSLPRRAMAWLAGASLAGAGAVTVAQWRAVIGGGGSLHFAGMVALDPFAVFGRGVLILLAAGAMVAAWPLAIRLERRGAEFVTLVLIALVGMNLMAASANLMMVFLGLEVASISLYVLAGITRARISADEAALKYFLLGSFASAVFLYGVALTYAATGTVALYEVASFLDRTIILQPGIFLAGLALLLVGLGFKVSAVPFHMWSPDVYQGAPAGAVAFMSAGAKVAGFAALARVLVAGFGASQADWAPAVAALAALSVVVGTVLAIAQSDVRRMLAYSSVAHAGFILTGLVAGGDGLVSVWFYLSTYGIQLVAAFTVVAVVAGAAAGPSALADYAGLSQRSPFLAGVMTVTMIAMGGIPLTAGFVGKVAVFRSALEAGYLWLVLVGLVAAAAGLFFYLRLIVLMYMQAPEVAPAPGAARAEPGAGGSARLALGVATGLTVLLGIFPGPLLDLIEHALPL